MDIDGEAVGDLFGYSLSISSDGSTTLVGARQNAVMGVNSGHARVYNWEGTS